MADVTKINHEPVEIAFNNISLGIIAEGDVSITFNTEVVEQKSHQYGAHTIQAYNKGFNPVIEAAFQEIDTISNWARAFDFTGSDQSSGADNRFAAHTGTAGLAVIGQKATAVAQALTLRPLRHNNLTFDVSNEQEFDVVFPLAYCMNVDAISFGIDTALVLPLTFGTLFNPAATEGENAFFRGKLTGTWVDG